MSLIPGALGSLLGNRASFSVEVEGVAGPRVVRFTGHEGISTLYEFRVEIASEADVNLGGAVGKRAKLWLDGLDAPRLVHGEVASIEYVGEARRFSLYEVTIVPRLWRLLHRTSCRIFQHKTTPDVVREVLKKAGLAGSDFRFDLGAAYKPRNYCVQYRESDLAFLQRLLEEDGIFYFFEHQADRAVLVFGDHVGVHGPIPGVPLLWFNAGGELLQREHISEVRVSEGVRSGKVSLRDYNFHKPDQKMEVAAEGKQDADLEVYDYPGEYQEPESSGPHQGKSMAKIRLEALQVPRRQVSGASDCMRLVPGHSFTLKGHRRAELNQEMLLLQVVHQGTQPQSLDEDGGQGAFRYGNQFTCIDRSTPYRPPRLTPRPVVRGIQSATVVGSGSEEVDTDEEGRVLVQFHWDRDGKFDENSSCWVRVSQLWAGNGWGAMFIPRVGHEVLVDFIEGDPDRPIVTGRVYHANNSLPYPLPAEKTKTTIKSDSSPGGGGFNELRFEDRKGSEEVFFHAQKDLNEVVLNDNSRTVTANQTFSVGGNQSFTITKNRSVTVTDGDESLTVSKGKSTTTVEKNRSVTVQSGDSSLTVASGTHTVTVEKTIKETSNTANIELTANKAISLTAANKTLKATAKKLVFVMSQTSSMVMMALKAVVIQSKTSILSMSGKQAVSLQSTDSTLTLASKAKAWLVSKDAVGIGAPNKVSVDSKEVAVTANKIVVTGTAEITLQVGASAITIKPDGITTSSPKITTTAMGMHEISGALIKIN